MFRKRLPRAFVALITVSLALSLCTVEAADTPPDYPIDNGHYFTQGSGGQQGGYSLTDDGGIPLWSEFKRLGGVDVLGYPVSGRFTFDGRITQLTQKVGLVWYPESNQARFMNIYSQLRRSGKDAWLAGKGIPTEAPFPDEAGKSWQDVSQKRYQLLDTHPAVKSVYFAVGDPVNMYGLPMSNWLETPLQSTLRFQNVALQQWKQVVPWAAAGQVSLANGGDLLKESGILGPTPFALQAPPDQALLTVPAGFAEISFYADFFVGRSTSSGLVFKQEALTCASNAFPLGTTLRLSTMDGARSVVVRNVDRPAAGNPRIDLSKAAFAELYPLGSGIGQVKVEVVK